MIFMLMLLLYQARHAQQASLCNAVCLDFSTVDRAQHFVLNFFVLD